MTRFVEWLERNRLALVFTSFLLCAAGIYSYTVLPKDVFPNSQFPRFQVIADIGFASLETTDVNVTRPLENALKTVPGVQEVRSVTERGTSTIDLYLKWGSDLDQAYQYAQARISQARAELPAGASIDLVRMNTSAYPMSEYGIWSDTLTLRELYTYAQYYAVPALIGAEGVYRLDVTGGEEPELQIRLDPAKVAALNLDAAAIQAAVAQANNISFIGTVTGAGKTLFAVGGTRLTGPADVGAVVIATRMGRPVLLRDVAEVAEGSAETRRLVTINGHPGLFIDVMKQNDADGLKLSKDLDARFAALEKESGGKVRVAKWDLSDFVRGSIDGILIDIAMGILIILGIIYYVMVRLRYSLPIMLLLPVVLVTEFLALRLLGLSVNIMTLGGLAAAIGIIADNAIVITENYVKFRERGDASPLASSMHYIVPITVWATLVSIVVFIPLNLLSGVSGLFFRPLAATLATTIAISLALAVCLLPVLIHYFIEMNGEPAREERERAFFVRLKTGYLKLLDLALGHGRAVAAGVAALLAAAALTFALLPTGFLPEWDEGDIVFDYVAPSGSSLAAVDALVKKAEKVIESTPETAMFVRKTGTHMGTPYAPPNRGEIVVLLKKDRDRSTFEVMDDLRARTAKAVPELDVDLHQILPDRLGDLTGNVKPIVVSVTGSGLDKAWAAAKDIQARLEKIDGLNGVMIDLPPAQPEIKVTPDQARLSLLGLGSADAFGYSGLALYGEVPTTLQRGVQQVPVRALYAGPFRSDRGALAAIPVYTPNGGVLPLGRFMKFSVEDQVPEVHHRNGSIVVSVDAELGGRPLGAVVKDVKAALAQVPPGDYTVELGGDYSEQQKSFSELLAVLVISVVLILALLLYIFESYRTSLAVFAGTLASATFVIFGLKLSGMEFDVSSFTGMITVMGIVVNNGILVIDFAERYRAEGMAPLEAVKAAGELRFRPVLITNLAAIAGFLPMALNIGRGGEVLRPFSVAMISGLVGSMFFSLTVIPVLYLLLHGGGRKKAARTI